MYDSSRFKTINNHLPLKKKKPTFTNELTEILLKEFCPYFLLFNPNEQEQIYKRYDFFVEQTLYPTLENYYIKIKGK